MDVWCVFSFKYICYGCRTDNSNHCGCSIHHNKITNYNICSNAWIVVKLQCIQQYKCWHRWIKETLQKYHDFSVSKQHFKFSIVLINRIQNLFPGHQQKQTILALNETFVPWTKEHFIFLIWVARTFNTICCGLMIKSCQTTELSFFSHVLFVSSWFVKASQWVVWSKQPVCVCVCFGGSH